MSVERVVAAFQRVRQILPDATLTIVGCSPAVQGPGISVLGRLPPEAVDRHFAEAALFCMPSRLEPFGIVYVEALHYSLPIVATDVCDIGDFVIDGENGFLVEPQSPEALAAAIVSILGDPAVCRAYGLRSGALADDNTWRKVAERIGAALPELGAPRRVAP